MLSQLLFSIYALLFVTVCPDADRCEYYDFGIGFLSKEREIKCNGARACIDCTMVCYDCELINCGGLDSCRAFNDSSAVALTNGNEDFQLECTGQSACKRNDGAGAVWEIHCVGSSIKGIKCGGYESCQNAYFIIIGDYDSGNGNSCQIEKIECDGLRSCQGATFDFRNAEVEEFVCGGKDSCDSLTCQYDMATGDCPELSW
eukprot:CAMPEP_0197025860 /NCGR_PEP_ID=MMETSP1384-20130603/6069_1 /TAXON_ID=29189 /ORGANISM="Ammonia sp." /LENGTH=201 /DNA_ID=CAMNT_0042454437 /DNA_START=115 /DNA_END=720 /DNA_ORIENTATION=+